jgi:transposase
MPKSYVPEFRRRVIELRRGGRPARVIAQELEVSEATVNRWVAQEEVDLGERPGVRSGEHIELSRARVRIRELESELELTREASALFDEQQGRPAPKGSTR